MRESEREDERGGTEAKIRKRAGKLTHSKVVHFRKTKVRMWMTPKVAGIGSIFNTPRTAVNSVNGLAQAGWQGEGEKGGRRKSLRSPASHRALYFARQGWLHHRLVLQVRSAGLNLRIFCLLRTAHESLAGAVRAERACCTVEVVWGRSELVRSSMATMERSEVAWIFGSTRGEANGAVS